MTLEEFLRDGAAKPFAWGICDCSLWPADWIVASRGVDPAPDLRGAYSCWIGAIRRVRREGGLTWVFGRRLEAIGMHVTADPQPGDLGVIRAGAHVVGAVRSLSGWAVKRERGLVIAKYETIMAWSF